MNTNTCVASAGRVVLEMMQYDWEPLSHGELDQRLDQAVEEILEAEILAKVEDQGNQLLLQVPQLDEPLLHLQTYSQDFTQPQLFVQLSDTITANPDNDIQKQSAEEAEENASVQHIMDLLKNANTKHNRSRLAGRARLSLCQTVLLSLTLLTKRRSYRSVSTSFRLEKGNIHRIFFSFCERVNALKDQQIRWPKGVEMSDNLLPFSNLLGMNESMERQMPKVLGVLGHTRIPIRLPIGKQDAQREDFDLSRVTREVHPDSWLNLEVVCDSQGRFIHCRVSRGSDQDRATDLRTRIEGDPAMVPPGCCLVAGLGYPLTEQILTPYALENGPRENLFNSTLESHLSRLDQAIGGLKARFQRLKYLDMGNWEKAMAVVLTACILQNVFVDMGDVALGQAERETASRELELRGEMEEGGVRWRDVVSQQLFDALEEQTDKTDL